MASIDVLATLLEVPRDILREALAEIAKEVYTELRKHDEDDGR